jgi:hypothetical protein
MNFITHINKPSSSYVNKRPVDNADLGTFNAKSPVAKYYRKTSSCCNNRTTQIYKNVKCCVKPTYSANTVISKDYYQTHAQYIKSRCKTYDQNNSRLQYDPISGMSKPNCTSSECNSTTYKRSNSTFSKQGAVSSSNRLLQLKYNSIQTTSRFNPYQSNYSGDNTQNTFDKPEKCVNYRRNGDASRCD